MGQRRGPLVTNYDIEMISIVIILHSMILVSIIDKYNRPLSYSIEESEKEDI